jgi:hypothetical protein
VGAFGRQLLARAGHRRNKVVPKNAAGTTISIRRAISPILRHATAIRGGGHMTFQERLQCARSCL